MRNRIERLRVWLLLAAGLLVAVLVVFIGSAGYLKRHFLARLPARLGVDIKSETNGFTYSQSVQGRTIFTVHAAKEVEHASGSITLHDVSMVVYGRTGERADRIEGKQFEYDPTAGVLRAVGLVHMDLGAAGSASTMKAGGAEGATLLHATTSGLVYLEKPGVATTSEAIDFETGRMKGHAIGAEYNTDSGVLRLRSAVRMVGVSEGRATELTAGSAELADRGQRVVLSGARYVSGEETMESQDAVVYVRPDDTLERVEAWGEVKLGRTGATVTAARATMAMSAKNRPENAVLTGGVGYSELAALRQVQGQAAEARIRFDGDGVASDAVLTSGVEMTERTRGSEGAREPWSVRVLRADWVHTTMLATGEGAGQRRSVLHTADAKGGARLTVVDNGHAGTRGRGTTELAGDELRAQLLPPAGTETEPRLDTVVGVGHTLVRQVDEAGMEQTSSGDRLDARFREAAAGGTDRAGSAGGAGELASAVQEGHVVLTRQAGGTAGTGAERATAARAVYRGDTDRVELTGGVQLSGSDSELWAEKVSFARATGDAQAEGDVKVSYVAAAQDGKQAGAAGGGGLQTARERDPVHVLADRAELVHATQVATFFGRPARMWQGGSQVEAPVLELAQKEQELTARGAVGGSGDGPAEVRTILTEATAPVDANRGARSPATRAGKAPDLVRIVSRKLVYSDAAREARFTGGVVVAGDGETIRSREATAYLAESGAGHSGAGAGPGGLELDGGVERVIALGDVTVLEPGRRARGDKLSYTAADGTVVLTGSAAAPPTLVDATQGTSVSAAAFRFRRDGETVEALSAVPEGAFERQVRTVTPVKR